MGEACSLPWGPMLHVRCESRWIDRPHCGHCHPVPERGGGPRVLPGEVDTVAKPLSSRLPGSSYLSGRKQTTYKQPQLRHLQQEEPARK